MTLSADVLEGVDAHYQAFGVEAVHTDRDDAETCVTAILEFDLQEYSDVANISALTGLVSVRRSDLSYPPRRGETYTIAGTVYTVDSVPRADDLEHTALVA